MEAVKHHEKPDYTWDYLGPAMFTSYPQTTELWREAKVMDDLSLCT